MRHTSSTAGLSTRMLMFASGSFSAPASWFGNSAITSVHTTPSTKKVHHATEKIRRTWFGRFIVFASLIMRESATGSPAVASVRNTLYIL